jgi:hypothetical protein
MIGTSHLFTTLYPDRHSDRRAELDYAIALNAQAFDHVHVMVEGMMPVASSRNVEHRHESKRATFADLIAWSRSIVRDADLCVLANCDIVFPLISLQRIGVLLDVRDVRALCLSRYEIEMGGTLRLNDFEWSQDSWALRGRPSVPIESTDYFFGCPGCDNRFAHALRTAGYEISNPSGDVVTIHLHRSGKRTVTNGRRHRVPPPYATIKPHGIGESPDVKTDVTPRGSIV